MSYLETENRRRNSRDRNCRGGNASPGPASRAGIAACFALAAASLASAEDGRSTLTVSLENDLFGSGTDEHYTHGTEITYVSGTYQPDFLKSFARAMGLYNDGDDLRVGFSLGQQMFTPSDITVRERIPDDRPYAGWLYGSAGMYSETRRGDVRSIDKLELTVGIVGPDSRAEEVQKAIHEISDSDEPKGWDNQLHNEATYDVAYQHEWVLPIVADRIDAIPMVALTLGTSQRYAATGMALRFGDGLGADSGPPLIRPSASASHYFKPQQDFYWYVFVAAHGRYVQHNIFLDGGDDDHIGIDKRDWVGEAQGGLVLGWRRWRFTLTEIVRTREFERQDSSDEYGSIAISYRL